MADFSKISADKAQQIINALKDGKINSNEAKDLKLTPEEAAALNQAFSSGEARIGDFVLVNKGKSKDGKKQYSQTKTAEQQVPQEEPSLLNKALGKIKKDLSKYAKTFTNAWNNNNGIVDVTGAMIGAATQTATDVVKDNAKYIEKGVEHVTGSKTAGKIASHAVGVGFVADAAEAVEQAGDWSADKIRDVAKNYTGTERKLLEKFADYVDKMNIADIALLFASGAGVVKGFKELPKVLNLLKAAAPALAKGTVAAGVVAGGMTMTSCSEGDEPVLPPITNSNTTIVNITIPASDQKVLLDAAKAGFDALTEEMKKLGLTMKEYGDQIIKLLTQNNTYLNGIAEDMKQNNKDNTKIIEMLSNITATVDTISSLIEATNENITVNGANIKNELSAILKAIKEGQANNEATLNAYMEKISALLQTVIIQQGDQITLNKDSNTTLKDILNKLQNLDGTTNDKLAAILAVLGDIKSIGNEINGKLDAIINKIENQFSNNKEIKAALEKIEQYLKQHNDKTDVTNNLLTTLLNKVQNGGLSEAALQKILEAIAKNGSKIDTTNKLLENMSTQNEKLQKEILNYIAAVGFEMNGHLNKILEAVNNIKGGNGANVEALLEKILAKMDGNTNDIIKAIANIKVNGGTVDLSSVEAMLNELIKISKANGDKLSSIDSRLNVLNVTTKAIEEELKKQGKANGERYEKLMVLLNSMKDAVGKPGNNFDDTKLMKALELISGKLDDILAAIKDHDVKVTVDVTGSVKCECNCGKNHEGILGNLEDILG